MQRLRRQAYALLNFVVQMREKRSRGFCRGLRATDLELVAPRGDRHTQALFDLAQVCIKLSAEGSQITGVIGFEGQA